MIIGVPKETKEDDTRVSILPSGVDRLVFAGHQVIIEKNAGLASGISDEDFIKAGAKMVPTMGDVYKNAELIFKVKEVTQEECEHLREGHILLGYYLLQSKPELAKILLEKKVIVYAYERLKDERGEYPLLAPMSELSGNVAVILGAYYLFNTDGGNGILIGGYPGVEAAKVTILGAGNSGLGAVRYAASLGAEVTLLDRNVHKLKSVKESTPGVRTFLINSCNLKKILPETDLLINSLKYMEDDYLITKDMLKLMKPNSLIVDADGKPHGAIETIRGTTHSDPCYTVDGIRHIAIPNYPSAVPRTSTAALANATIPYVIEIANKGWEQATRENEGLKNSLIVAKGHLTDDTVASKINLY